LLSLSVSIVFLNRCLIFAALVIPSEMNQFVLLQSQVMSGVDKLNEPSSYFPIGIQMVFALVFVAAMLALSHLLGPRRVTTDKLQTFESGIEQRGNARQPMAVKYFLVAILFVLFDVEVIFFYPYAVNFRELGWNAFAAVILFILFFLAGFIYIIKKGALHWED
jgi:NADH-quinone oxidoreductase subunit A